jgi:hypothetical protein
VSRCRAAVDGEGPVLRERERGGKSPVYRQQEQGGSKGLVSTERARERPWGGEDSVLT